MTCVPLLLLHLFTPGLLGYQAVPFPLLRGLTEVNLGHNNESNELMFEKYFSVHSVFMLHLHQPCEVNTCLLREALCPGHVPAAQWSEASLGLDPSPNTHKLRELSPVIYLLEASNFLIYKTGIIRTSKICWEDRMR